MTQRSDENLSHIIGREATAVDLSSTDYTDARPFYIWVGVGGDVKVDLINSTGVTFKNVPEGWLEVWARKVYKVGTSADELLACRG